MKKILCALGVVFLGSFSLLFADGAAAPSVQPEGNNMFRTLMFMGIVAVFFYLILYRPEQKRRKKLEAQRNSLKQGDQVTAMGIIGEVSKINEQTVILKMYDGTKIEVLKAAISDLKRTVEPTAEKKVEKQQPEPAKS